MNVHTPMTILRSLEKIHAMGKYNMLMDQSEILRELSRRREYETVSYLVDLSGAYLKMKQQEYIQALTDLEELKKKGIL